MADHLTLQNGKAVLTTEEGASIERPESDFMSMMQGEFLPPLQGMAMPDGLKFMEWRAPFLIVVHQIPPHRRLLRWIAPDSPAEYGPGTVYRPVRLSVPYSITFATYFQRGDALCLGNYNELYFRNQPLRSMNDKLCYPALLNISRIKTPTRERSWICTQHLKRSPKMDWTEQLESLLDHTWNGGFNLSSENHEGASYYGLSKGIHPDIHPVEKWGKASEKDEAFALSVPWKPAKHTVGELIECLFAEQAREAPAFRRVSKAAKPSNLVARFMNYAKKNSPPAAKKK